MNGSRIEPARNPTNDRTHSCVNDRGIPIVLIEHVLPLLLELSQRIIVLNQGQKLAEGIPSKIVQNELVIEAYLGRRTIHDA